MRRILRKSGLFAIALLVLSAPASAAMMLKMDLEQLTSRAGKIFMGTVIDVQSGTVTAGGGELPIVTYRIRVDQLFKGEATETKGDVSIIEVRMVGSLKSAAPDESGRVRLSPFYEVPRLKRGSDYLLFTSPESTIGLSATIGLGQGAFRVYPDDGVLVAVNEFNNAGLGLEGSGPVEVQKLGASIRALLGQ